MLAKGVVIDVLPHDEPWERTMTAFDPDGYSVEMVQGRRGKKEQGRVRHRGRNYWAFPKPSMATDRLPGTGSAPHMHGKAPLVIATKRFTGRYRPDLIDSAR